MYDLFTNGITPSRQVAHPRAIHLADFPDLINHGMFGFVRYSGGVMARRKESGFVLMASLPWPVGIVVGLVGYIGIRYDIGWVLGSSQSPLLEGVGKQAATGIYAPLGWILLLGCLSAALTSRFSANSGERGRSR
jgi:hypothetical protein